MLKQNKKRLIVTSLIILLPSLIGVALWNRLPEHMPSHWNINGDIDGWSSRPFVVFGVPLIMLAAHWLCAAATCLDKRNVKLNAKPFGVVLYVFPFVSLLTYAATYSSYFGYEFNMTRIVSALIGAMFFAIGNYMPKCRQNATLGIKVYWTLANEENWNRTHRFGGRVWVTGGALLMLAAFLPGQIFSIAMTALMLLMILAPILYSFLLYRRQKANGVWEINGVTAAPGMKRLSNAFAIVIVIFVAVLMFSGNISVEFGEDAFTIEASYWPDSTIAYADIDSIEYREGGVDGLRTSGFGSARLLMGQFNNDEFGYYTRYTYTGCDEAIVLTVDGSKLVISAKDAGATQALYAELTARLPID